MFKAKNIFQQEEEIEYLKPIVMRSCCHKVHGRHQIAESKKEKKKRTAIVSPQMPLQEVNTNGLLVGLSEVTLAEAHIV